MFYLQSSYLAIFSDFDELQAGSDGTDASDRPDADRDGVTDASEGEMGTDPNHPDSDRDGASDGQEVAAGTDALDPDDTPNVKDYDMDGVGDILEEIMGTDPNNPDTDGDGARLVQLLSLSFIFQ